jgi:cobyrinic acid a,c-diamide synthase
MSGKTIISTAIMYGLLKRGLRAAPFKIGPDYIDPSYHRAFAGVPSRNLDYVLMGEEGVLRRFAKYSAGFDVAVVEGVLGLYDSVDGYTELGSTAQVAKAIKAPVVLVLDGERTNRTLKAVVRGLKSFDPAVRIPAVILTNITRRQAEKLSKSLSEEVEVIGAVPRSDKVAEAFSYRHLGLTPVGERGDAESLAEVIERYVLPYIDLDALLRIAKDVEPLEPPPAAAEVEGPPTKCRVGVVADRAFTFYYPEVLEEAAAAGEAVLVNSLRDSSIPDVDLLIIGGGFPEVLAEELERNRPFRSALAQFAERGGRIYAECGGLMYLTSSIIVGGEEYEMVGVIEGHSVMLKKPVGKGYAWGRVVGETPIAPLGAELKGHEFHYSKLILKERVKAVIKLERGVGIGEGRDGIVKWNTHAQYLHLHPYTYNVVRAVCGSPARAR